MATFFVLLGLPAAALGDEFDDHLKDGNRFINEQKYVEAVREFEAAYRLKKQPDLALNLGRLYLKLRRGEAAQRYCAQYLTEEFEPPAERKAKAVDCVTQAKRLVAHKTKAEVEEARPRVPVEAPPAAEAKDPVAPPVAATVPPAPVVATPAPDPVTAPSAQARGTVRPRLARQSWSETLCRLNP